MPAVPPSLVEGHAHDVIINPLDLQPLTWQPAPAYCSDFQRHWFGVSSGVLTGEFSRTMRTVSSVRVLSDALGAAILLPIKALASYDVPLHYATDYEIRKTAQIAIQVNDAD